MPKCLECGNDLEDGLGDLVLCYKCSVAWIAKQRCRRMECLEKKPHTNAQHEYSEELE